MRKPVISSEISPKFDGASTTDTLPVSQLTENIVYQTHITLFSVLSKPEMHSSIGNPFKYHASGILSTQAPDLTTMCSGLSPDSSDNISPTSNKTIPNTTNFHGGVAGVFNVTERVTKSDGNWVA